MYFRYIFISIGWEKVVKFILEKLFENLVQLFYDNLAFHINYCWQCLS